MPSQEIDKLLKRKLDRLEIVPSRFSESVLKSQKEIFAEVRIILEAFDRDPEGRILTSEKNIKLINDLKVSLKRVLYQSEYLESVREFAKEIDNQADINKALFSMTVDYGESAITASLIKQSKTTAVDALLGGSMDSVFYNPVIAVINNAVSTNSGIVETTKALRLVVEGGESNGSVIDGRLLRYSKQIASDSFAISDRTYNNQVSDELGLMFGRYVGGVIEDTRAFCKARNSQFYHKKEVESWVVDAESTEGNPSPNGHWQGQFRGTNSGSIFNLCGGYNCKHTFMPVSIAAVPKDVIQRNLDSGNLTLDDKEKSVLGLAA